MKPSGHAGHNRCNQLSYVLIDKKSCYSTGRVKFFIETYHTYCNYQSLDGNRVGKCYLSFYCLSLTFVSYRRTFQKSFKNMAITCLSAATLRVIA